MSLDHGQLFCGDGLRCRSADRALAHGIRGIDPVGEHLCEVVLDIKLNEFPAIHYLSMYPVSLLGRQAPHVPGEYVLFVIGSRGSGKSSQHNPVMLDH